MSWFSKNVGKTTRTESNQTQITPIPRGQLGSLGDLLFNVTNEQVITFRDYSRKIGVRLTEHDVIGSKSVVEYIAPELQTINFKIQLHSSLGIDPLIELDRLEKMCENGEVNHLIIGNTIIGANQWIIENIAEEETIYTPKGEILYTELTVSLKEYV